MRAYGETHPAVQARLTQLFSFEDCGTEIVKSAPEVYSAVSPATSQSTESRGDLLQAEPIKLICS